MKKKEKLMDVVFILDRSGSMRGTEKDTIGGYNSYIAKFKDKNAKITTVLFDDKYEMITKRKDINEISYLTEKEYYVRGCEIFRWERASHTNPGGLQSGRAFLSGSGKHRCIPGLCDKYACFG